jgi:RNA polymerase sigma factor (sigma-70 family)
LLDERHPPEGFEDFYETNFRTVARAVHLTLGNADEAADMAQEAFVRTWAQWGRVGRRERPVLFTLRVARNLATSRVRQLIRHRRAVRMLAGRADPAPTEAVGSVITVRQALRQLPQRQRWAVVLCDMVGLSSSEAASIVGVSPSTMRVHLARARARLRLALFDQDTPDAALRERTHK